MTDPLRLFIGTGLCGAGQRSLERLYQKREAIDFNWPGKISWTPPEKWHLTWLFLGDMPVGELGELKERLIQIPSSVSAPIFQLNRLEIWPSIRRPRMAVWCGDGEALSPVAARIRTVFSDFPADKPFCPHVTLARFRPNRNRTTKSRPTTQNRVLPHGALWPEPANWQIRHITLFRSHLNRGGAYEALCTVSFTEA